MSERGLLRAAYVSPTPVRTTQPETVFDYYVDATNGADANTGLTPLLAKQTLAGIVALGASLAGKRIGLKRGDTYRETFNLASCDGTTAAPTVVGAWGSGARPVVKTTTVQATSAWSVYSGSVYTGTATGISTAAGLWVDETNLLVRMADAASIVAPGQFYSTSNTLYVWMPDSSNPSGHVFEKRASVSACMNTSVANLRIEDISFRQACNSIANIYSGQNTVIRRCEYAYNSGSGIYVSNRAIIEYCDVHHNWNGKEYSTGSSDGNGIFITTTGAHGTIVRYNKLWENLVQIKISVNARDVLVHNNSLFLAHVNGIDHQGASAFVYNNFIHHRPTGTNASGHGIDTQAGGTALTAKNNVIYCDYTGGAALNIQCITLFTGSGHSVDYNSYYVTAPTTNVDIGKKSDGTLYATLALWQAASGQDAHSISVVPTVVDLAGRDSRPLPGSPILALGTVVPGITDAYVGSTPDMGPYQR